MKPAQDALTLMLAATGVVGLSACTLYGFTVRQSATPAAQAFAKFLMAPQAQAVFKRSGFGES